jgi:hypothetical protein
MLGAGEGKGLETGLKRKCAGTAGETKGSAIRIRSHYLHVAYQVLVSVTSLNTRQAV